MRRLLRTIDDSGKVRHVSTSNTPGGYGPQQQGHGDGWGTPPRVESGYSSGGPTHGYQPGYGLPPSPYSAPIPEPVHQPPTPSWRQTRRHSHRGLWIALLILVVLLVVGGGAAAAYASVQAGAVAQAARQFCAALQADDYSAAYSGLASAYQEQTPRDQFIADGKLHDQLDSRVTACSANDSASGPLGSLSHLGSSSITLNARIRRAITYTGPITLVKQGGDWKIAAIAASLQGTNLAPLKSGRAFCAALVAGNYQAAYGMLTGGQQSQVSERQFAAQFTDTFIGSPMRLAGCDLDLTTYFISGSTSKVNVRLTITNPQASSGLLTIALTIVQQDKVWKIDDIQLAD